MVALACLVLVTLCGGVACAAYSCLRQRPPPLPSTPSPSRRLIEVDLLTPRSCGVKGCPHPPRVPVALSSRSLLMLCAEHALALEFQKVRWGIREPRAALRGLGRVRIARA